MVLMMYVSARMDESRGRAWGGSDFALVQIQGQNANTDTVQIPLQIQSLHQRVVDVCSAIDIP